MLSALLTAHPEIAGVGTESHLFESGWGVGALYDNYEGDSHGSYLAGYVSRERLVDLVRDLCDGVFEEMRSRVAPQARFVVEKTAAPLVRPEVPLARKRECYPDAWALHVVREPAAVVRSLRRAPWNPERSRAGSERWRRGAVAAIRAAYRDHPRYREVGYEELVSDPTATMDGVFSWLGLESGEELRTRVSRLAGQRFSELRGGIDGGGATVLRRGARAAAKRALGPARRLAGRVDGGVAGRRELAEAFATAVSGSDARALARLTAETLVVELRSGEGDLRADGERAVAALAAVGRRVFARDYLSQSWAVTTGDPFTTVLFSGLRSDASRVDLAWSLGIADGRITRVGLVSAGSLDGRPVRELPLAEQGEGVARRRLRARWLTNRRPAASREAPGGGATRRRSAALPCPPRDGRPPSSRRCTRRARARR